jgi:acyl-CoA thioesterase II
MPPVDVDSFVAALGANPVGRDRFAAENPRWGGSARVFGGVAVAHALAAACGTVPEPEALHSMHGHFLRAAAPGSRSILRVDRLRDGRSFGLRAVEASVDGQVTFRATCSFHRPESGEEYQLIMPAVPGPEAVAHLEIQGAPWPLVVRDLGPTGPAPDGTYAATRRAWFRLPGPLSDDPTIHLRVAAFYSDMTGSAFRPRSLGVFGEHADASLDHALWFHRPFRVDRWVLYDLQALTSGGGRSTVRGLLFDQEGGLCLSMVQELSIRRLDEPRPVGPADRA